MGGEGAKREERSRSGMGKLAKGMEEDVKD